LDFWIGGTVGWGGRGGDLGYLSGALGVFRRLQINGENLRGQAELKNNNKGERKEKRGGEDLLSSNEKKKRSGCNRNHGKKTSPSQSGGGGKHT